MKRLRPRTLTIDHLKALGACEGGLNGFADAFPDGLKLTSREALLKAYLQIYSGNFDLDWLPLMLSKQFRVDAKLARSDEREGTLLDLVADGREAFWAISNSDLDYAAKADINTLWEFFLACDAADVWLWEKRK